MIVPVQVHRFVIIDCSPLIPKPLLLLQAPVHLFVVWLKENVKLIFKIEKKRKVYLIFFVDVASTVCNTSKIRFCHAPLLFSEEVHGRGLSLICRINHLTT